MKVCPECGYEENPSWRPARWDNPDGEVEVCRISDFHEINSTLAKELEQNRGIVLVEGVFAYLLGKRSVYVKRVRRSFFDAGASSAFKVPWEWTKRRVVRDASGLREKLPNREEQTKLGGKG